MLKAVKEERAVRIDGKVHVCTAWFRVLLKSAFSLLVFRVKKDWVEIMADNILVNETLIDNRLSDVHTFATFACFQEKRGGGK